MNFARPLHDATCISLTCAEYYSTVGLAKSGVPHMMMLADLFPPSGQHEHSISLFKKVIKMCLAEAVCRMSVLFQSGFRSMLADLPVATTSS